MSDDHIYKSVEITGSSTKGIQQAIDNAVAKASETLRHIEWFEVVILARQRRGRPHRALPGDAQDRLPARVAMSAPHEQGGAVFNGRRGFFWVGTERVSGAAGTAPYGRMYVEWLAPAEVTKPYPIVLVHGGGGQGTDYLGTPDGRPGWAQMLVEEGWAVYVVDRPGHGRSPLDPAVLGDIGPSFPYEAMPAIFLSAAGLAPDRAPAQPVAGLGRPRDRRGGRPVHLRHGADADATSRWRRRWRASASPSCWTAPGRRSWWRTRPAGRRASWRPTRAPGLVKALIEVETIGPPFADLPPLGVTLSWGLTAAPIGYDPPVSDPAELDGEPRAIPNLQGFPIAVVSAEASPFVHFDDQIVDFLKAAGLRRRARAPRRPRRPRQRPRDDVRAQQPRDARRAARLDRAPVELTRVGTVARSGSEGAGFGGSPGVRHVSSP